MSEPPEEILELLAEQIGRVCVVTVYYMDDTKEDYENVIRFGHGPDWLDIWTIQIEAESVTKLVLPARQVAYAVAVWDATENLIEAYRPRPVAVKGEGE